MHTLEQLSAFTAVYECGSYSSAGRHLGKDRTTVRELVHAYEDVLGYKLFAINGRKAIATLEAKALYSPALHVLRQSTLLNHLSQVQFGQQISELKIGYDGDFPPEFLDALDSKIQAKYPHIPCHWLKRDRSQALDLVEAGELNFAICPAKANLLPTQNILYKNLGYVHYNLYVGAHSPLAAKENFSLFDAQSEIQLVSEHANNANSIVKSYSANTKIVGCNTLLLRLLTHSGWALLPKHLVAPSIENKEIVPLYTDALANDAQVPFTLFYPVSSGGCEVSSNILKWSEELAKTYFC